MNTYNKMNMCNNNICKCEIEREIEYKGEIIIEIFGEDCGGEICNNELVKGMSLMYKDCKDTILEIYGVNEEIKKCGYCDNVDLIKYSCNGCNNGYCYDCYDKEVLNKYGDLFEVNGEWICSCECSECWCCNEIRMNDKLDMCDDCDKVYCKEDGEICEYGNKKLCEDCIGDCECNEGYCDRCSREYEEVVKEGDIMFDINGEYVCSYCV